MQKISFVNISLCLAELRSIADATSVVIHQIVDQIHVCTEIRMQSSLQLQPCSVTNEIANKCIEKVAVPSGFKFDLDKSTPCGRFNSERFQQSAYDLINSEQWNGCMNTFPQNSQIDPNNTFVSSVKSCVEIGRIVTIEEVNQCFENFTSSDIQYSNKQSEKLCNKFNNSRETVNMTAAPIDYFKFIPCFYNLNPTQQYQINLKALVSTCTVLGKQIFNFQANSCIDSVTDYAKLKFNMNSKCYTLNQERRNPNNPFNFMNWITCKENLAQQQQNYINQIHSCLLSL